MQPAVKGSSLPRYCLAVLSGLCFVLGTAWTLAPHGTAERLTVVVTAFRNPVVPLLLSLAFALTFVAASTEPARVLRRPVVRSWLAFVAGTTLVASLIALFRWSAGDVYPFGDPAILEIYTLHAVRGIWTLGPYSQFGWHHPGSLYFYLLAPLYLVSGEKTIALHVGAFAVTLLSLCGIGYTLIRHAASPVACTVGVALGVYLAKFEPIITNYWNPHVVIVPAALYLVVAAVLAAGRVRALPACVFVGSFLVQTHVSLAPYVSIVGAGALALGIWWRERTRESDQFFRRWILGSAALMALLWLLPIVEQATHSPGNVTRIMQFFGDPSPGQSLRTSVIVWGDMICAVFRTHVDVPEGLPLRIPDDSITAAGMAALAQAVLLAVACRDAMRRRDPFHAALTAAGLLASLVGLWSITRVKSLVGDYTIFWLSAIGAVNWAVIAGLAVTRAVKLRLRVLQQAVVFAAAVMVLWSFAGFGIDQLKRARRQGLRPPRGGSAAVQLASDAILQNMKGAHVQRAMFQLNTQDWGAAAGILLQVYKRSQPVAVDASLLPLFGEPLAPTGREDRVFVIADGAAHAVLTTQAGDEFLQRVDDIYIHARTADPKSMPATKR